MKCPKCEYERETKDSVPLYECPACGIVYAKYRPGSGRSQAASAPLQVTQRSPGVFVKMLQTKAAKIVAWAMGAIIALAIVANVLGPEFATFAAISVLAVWMVRKAIEGSRKQEQQRKAVFASQPHQHCMTCGHDFQYDQAAVRGSKTMEIALWILLLWPVALIYSIWRRLGAGKAKIACIVCASNQVIPATSPAAVAHKKALGITA